MLKKMIQERLVKGREEQYRKDLASKQNAYAAWYRPHTFELKRQIEAADHTKGNALSLEVVRYSHLRSYILGEKRKMPDIIVACDDDGNVTDYAEQMIRDFFAEHEDISFVYGDEDRIDEDGQLRDPWLKPDWSPDTFLSTFYIGDIFAFRSSELAMINPGGRVASDIEARQKLEADAEEEKNAAKTDLDDPMRSWIYGKLCMRLLQAEGGFTRRSGDVFDFPVGHIREILFHASRKPEPWNSNLIRGSLTGRFSSESAATRLISIIIPSKDNPKVLATCIHSIEKYTENSPYEIIVVDNGSSPENQVQVRRLLKAHDDAQGAARYIYAPMEFNFSRMCNLGANAANGELLLFLNDDIEIRAKGWLSYLSEKAKLPYVGCVGMKLLYPNSDMIQHAGVVNVHAGPIHKLQYCSNKEEHYFGYNKGVRNVIAVTGACLMLKASLFREVGGFDEENFAVAFNDIDLCLSVYEKGYYNVVRNNMYLYHHESLSRGDDRKDKIKAQRLSKEQERLLSRHPKLFLRDPFYHPYLNQDPAVKEFSIAVEDVELRNPHYTKPEKVEKAFPEKWTDPVLKLGVEYADSLDRWLTGPLTDAAGRAEINKGYYIKGYAFVINANQAVYDRKVLLKAEDGTIYEMDSETAYRPDIAQNLTDQINDRLTGFWMILKNDALPKGKYLIGMLAIDRTSRQRLVNWSDVELKVREGY
ncbi:MAG: glycosyltransferase [Lachnospiraceae bacterium]|jgi:GT2 family glycosyltransferase